MEDDPEGSEVLPALTRVVVGRFLDGGDDLVYGEVLEDAAESGDPA